jgi:hypothetical protein
LKFGDDEKHYPLCKNVNFNNTIIDDQTFLNSLNTTVTLLSYLNAAVSLPDGNLYVFAIKVKDCGMGNFIHHIWTEPHPYGWNQGAWHSVGQRFSFAGDPVAVEWAGDNIQVFAFDRQPAPPRGELIYNQLYHMWTEPHPYDWNKNPPGWRALTRRYNSYVRVHLKVLVDPTNFTIEEMADRMIEVFRTVDIRVDIATTERLNLPSLLDVDVGDCTMGNTTNEQNQLFNNRNNVARNEIVVYFVRSTDPPLNGCAAHPKGRPGAIVAQGATQWTLAHEVGHVLGLNHVEAGTCPTDLIPPDTSLCQTDRLMTCCGTFMITNPPADLNDGERTTMEASALTINC